MIYDIYFNSIPLEHGNHALINGSEFMNHHLLFAVIIAYNYGLNLHIFLLLLVFYFHLFSQQLKKIKIYGISVRVNIHIL